MHLQWNTRYPQEASFNKRYFVFPLIAAQIIAYVGIYSICNALINLIKLLQTLYPKLKCYFYEYQINFSKVLRKFDFIIIISFVHYSSTH